MICSQSSIDCSATGAKCPTPRVVDQDVESAEAIDGGPDEPGGIVRPADIRFDGFESPSTVRLRNRRQSFRRLVQRVGRPSGNNDIRAGREQALGHGPADSPRAASYDRRPTVQMRRRNCRLFPDHVLCGH